MKTYLEVKTTKDEAWELMRSLNRASSEIIVAMVEHPDGWAVCDLETAIDTGLTYEWAA
jgi:hypothetical protein